MRRRGVLFGILFLFIIINLAGTTKIAPVHHRDLSATREFNLTWTSRTNEDPTILMSGDTITGDQIVLHAEFPNIPDRPNLDIDLISWAYSPGFYQEFNQPLIIPDGDYNPFIDPIDFMQFAWVRVDGIEVSTQVSLELSWENPDGVNPNCDAMAWWAESDNSSWTYDNNILGSQMSNEGNEPENGYISTSAESGSIMIGIFNHGDKDGIFHLTADTRDLYFMDIHSNEFEYEISEDMYRNETLCFEFIGYAVDDSVHAVRVNSVTINSVFVPNITSISVEGTTTEPIIIWEVYDHNFQDSHDCALYVSRSNETDFDRIERGYSGTTYTWDARAYQFSEYVVKLIVTDSIEYQDIEISDPFLAGTNITLSVNSPDNISMFEGETGHSISWTPSCQTELEYEIYDGNSLVEDGTWVSGYIVFNLDGYQEGIHIFEIHLFEPINEISIFDAVTVEVFAAPPSPSDSQSGDTEIGFVLQGLSVGITLGSIFLIGIVAILIIHAKKNREGSWDYVNH